MILYLLITSVIFVALSAMNGFERYRRSENANAHTCISCCSVFISYGYLIMGS
ncbi:MAG: hypothetical protein J5666_02965 [Bacilli bacterium]|nr:hypothetical protein [Bacilli bacterium]